MLGSKKRHLLTDGAQAIAVVTDVGYATAMGIALPATTTTSSS